MRDCKTPFLSFSLFHGTLSLRLSLPTLPVIIPTMLPAFISHLLDTDQGQSAASSAHRRIKLAQGHA
jgi:hypothetical protein